MERGWAGASRVERAGIAREVFFYPSGDDLLYASHYARAPDGCPRLEC